MQGLLEGLAIGVVVGVVVMLAALSLTLAAARADRAALEFLGPRPRLYAVADDDDTTAA